jgi:hypothetical protein
MKRYYSKLEGKKVRVRINNIQSGPLAYPGDVIDCIVTGSEFSIGISIQDEIDKRYVICLNGTKSPNAFIKTNKPSYYRKCAVYIYDSIMSGKEVDVSHLTEIGGLITCSYIPASTCAFAQ